MSEAMAEYHPLLRSAEDIDATPVYPIIHMIRQVCLIYRVFRRYAESLVTRRT